MDDPLALDPETMRATGYRMVDLLVERVAGVRDWPALTRASPAEMRERLHGPAPEAGTGFDDAAGDARARRARPHGPRRPPRLLRVHPRLEHVAGRARRLPRQRAQRLRGLVDGVVGPEPGRAAGARLVQGVDRLPGRGVGDPAERRLGREHDRARVRARDAGRARCATTSSSTSPTRRTRRSRGRRARSASGPTRCAVLPVDERPPHAPRPARRRDGRRRRRGAAAAVRRPSAPGSTNTGAIDPLRRAGGDLRARTARGCTSTPPTAASRR